MLTSCPVGARDNKRIAINIAAATCFDGGILERNFSFIGPGMRSAGSAAGTSFHAAQRLT